MKGFRYGKWTVISSSRRYQFSACVCRCECGTVRTIHSEVLKVGLSKHCGCQNKDATPLDVLARAAQKPRYVTLPAEIGTLLNTVQPKRTMEIYLALKALGCDCSRRMVEYHLKAKFTRKGRGYVLNAEQRKAA